jgi:hypothetical protein
MLSDQKNFSLAPAESGGHRLRFALMLLAAFVTGLVLTTSGAERPRHRIAAQGGPDPAPRLSQTLPRHEPEADAIGTASGIALAADGRLAVLATRIAAWPRVVFFDPEGKVVDLWEMRGLDANGTSDVEFAADGSLLVGVLGAVEVWRDGQRSATWPLPEARAPNGNPIGLRVGRIRVQPDGQVHVSIGPGDFSKILRFDADGQPLGSIGQGGRGEDQLSGPGGFAYDEAGLLYVADTGNNRIQRYDRDGSWLGSWGGPGSELGQFNNPVDIRRLPDGFVVVDRNNQRLQWLADDGTPLAEAGGRGSEPGRFQGVWEIELAADGGIWAMDPGNARVQGLAPDGAPRSILGSGGAGLTVAGMTIDAGGDLLVADAGNLQILRLSPDGLLLDAWGRQGAGADEFSMAQAPVQIAQAGDGSLLISGMQRGVVQRFDAGGSFLNAFDGQSDEWPAFGIPRALRVAENDALWLLSDAPPYLRSYSLEGEPRAAFAGKGTQPGFLSDPGGLALLASGERLVSDLYSWQYFGPDGRLARVLRRDWPERCALPAADWPHHPAVQYLFQLADGRLWGIHQQEPYFFDESGRRLTALRGKLAYARNWQAAEVSRGGQLYLMDGQGGAEVFAEAADPPELPWQGHFYDNPWQAGWPVATERRAAATANGLQLDWPAGQAPEGLQDDAWSARWSRSLHLEAGQVFLIALVASGSLRLSLDGEVLAEGDQAGALRYAGRVDLKAGSHRVEVELRDRGGPVHLALSMAALDVSTVTPSPMLQLSPTASPSPPPPSPSATPLPPATPWSQRLPARIYLPYAESWTRDPRPTPPPAWLTDGAIDVEHYDLRLRVPEMGGEIQAELGIRLRAARSLDEIRLDAEPAALEIRAVFLDEEPQPFRIDSGQPNPYGLTGSQLVLPLGAPLAAGQLVELRIEYAIRADSLSGDKGFMYATDFRRIPVLITRNFPYYSRFYLPSHDHPSDPASFDIELRVPADMVGAANGRLLEGNYLEGEGLDAEGLRRFRWRQDQPMPTFGLNIAVGPFLVDSGEYCFDPEGDTAEILDCRDAAVGARVPWVSYALTASYPVDALLAGQALVHHAQSFGPYPFAKLGLLSAPHPYSNASPSLITLVGNNAIPHEIAHSWWGSGVQFYAAGWGEGWLSEGLANASDALFGEAVRHELASADCSCRAGSLRGPADVDPWDFYGGPERRGDLYCGGQAAFHDLRWRIAQVLDRPIWEAAPRRVLIGALAAFYRGSAGRPDGSAALVAALRSNLAALVVAEGGRMTQAEAEALVEEWAGHWVE